MTEESVRDAFVVSLKAWKRHAGALAVVVVAFVAASLLASDVAFYAAALVAFTTWMAWFVLTGVQFLRLLGL